MTTPQTRLSGPLCFLLFGLGLAGCAVGPDYEVPEYPMPDAWESAAAKDIEGEAPPIVDWWRAFNDPVLDSLMVRARAANLDLRVGVGRVAEARALRAVAGGDFWPQVQGNGDFTRQESQAFGDAPFNTWSAGLGATWELDLFGRVRRGKEAAEASFNAAIEDYRDVQVALLAEVAISYVTIRALQRRIEYAKGNVESQEETLEIVTARHDAGLVPLLDVSRARSNLANTEASIPLLKLNLASERNRLSVLLGLPPGEERLGLGPSGPIPGNPDSTIVMLPADLIRRRPDIRAAERQLAAQTARVGVATAELYPKFSLGGVLNVLSGDIDDLFSEDALGWSLTPGFSWNLFAGGKLRGQIRAEEARVDQALALYEKSILTALAEVESSIVALRQERIRRGRLEVAVEAAQESVELVRTQYIEGLTDFQSYLDAERVLFEQQDALAKSRGDVFNAYVGLNRALGGGWSPDEPEPDLPPEVRAQASTPPTAEVQDDAQGEDR
jgi:NodT family efflux transporter outer membrane factor (OMF) lipoprotein